MNLTCPNPGSIPGSPTSQMTIPVIFGLPLWRGKIKKRVAKKYLAVSMLRRAKIHACTKVGDYVNDCTGRNGKIQTIEPIYRRIGKGRGSYLLDIDFQTENTGCSFLSCGVEPKLPREVIEARHLSYLKNYILGEGGRRWYGADSAEYQRVVERAQKQIAALESGLPVFNEDGSKILPEFEQVRL